MHPNLHDVVFALCAYECVAIASRRVPTLSAIARKHRWLAPVMVGSLTVHLYRDMQRVLDAEVDAAVRNERRRLWSTVRSHRGYRDES